MIYDTDIDTYYRLKECLYELFPEIKVKLISSDPMLKKLGFTETIPCVVEVCAENKKIDEIRNIAIDYEITACALDDYPDENDIVYRNYLRYSWLYDFL